MKTSHAIVRKTPYLEPISFPISNNGSTTSSRKRCVVVEKSCGSLANSRDNQIFHIWRQESDAESMSDARRFVYRGNVRHFEFSAEAVR